MAALDSIDDYVADARVLLQDIIPPYRYDDTSVVTALNLAFYEGRRIRPDLFIYNGATVPTYTIADLGKPTPTPIVMEQQFRQAFVFGTVAHAFARDQEDVQDQRANTFMGYFQAMLIGVKVGAIQGGTPGGAPPQQGPGS